jgi:hypothetical protein
MMEKSDHVLLVPQILDVAFLWKPQMEPELYRAFISKKFKNRFFNIQF